MIYLLEPILKLDIVLSNHHGIQSTDLEIIRVAVIFQNKVVLLSKISSNLTRWWTQIALIYAALFHLA